MKCTLRWVGCSLTPVLGLLFFPIHTDIPVAFHFFFAPVSSQPHPVRWWRVWVLLRQHHWMLQSDIRICPSNVREYQVSSCEAWVRVHHCRLRLRRRWHINATAVRMRQRATKDLWKWITYPRYLWRSTHKWFQVLVSSIAGLVHGRIHHIITLFMCHRVCSLSRNKK